MPNNTQPEKVTIVQVLNSTPEPNPSPSTGNLLDIIENNSLFLNSHNVEYIIFDSTQDNFILQNLQNMSCFQHKKIEYLRKSDINLKEIFLTSLKLAKNPNIFFVFNQVKIDINNVYEIEKSAPILQKKDLEFFKQNIPPNFHPKDFKLYMKKEKNIWDRIKLLFI